MKYLLSFCLLLCAVAVFGIGCAGNKVPKVAESASEIQTANRTRNLTCRVRGQFSKDLRYGFLSWAIHDEVPERVRKSLIVHGALVAMGGSGFPVWTDGKKTWVATNAHVLESLDREVVLTFDAGETNLTGRIVYIDTRYDLGFVEVKKSLPLVNFAPKLHEHLPVIAAGYPGGSYRLTAGRISNRCFQFSKLERSLSDDCWIEHTAVIDPGSSGGPLYTERNQQVVGMNTLSFYRRNDMYLALPGAVVQKRLEHALAQQKVDQERKGRRESLRKTCHTFMSELDSDLAGLEVLGRTLSDDLAIELGLSAILRLKEKDGLSERTMNIAMYYDPYFVVQFAVLKMMSDGAQELGGLHYEERCENINPGDDLMDSTVKARVIVRFDKARVETAWKYDRGGWRLVYLRPKIDGPEQEKLTTSETLKALFGDKCRTCKGKSKPVCRDDSSSCDSKKKAEPEDAKPDDSQPDEAKPDDKDKKEAPPPDSSGCTCIEDEEKGESRCDCPPESE